MAAEGGTAARASAAASSTPSPAPSPSSPGWARGRAPISRRPPTPSRATRPTGGREAAVDSEEGRKPGRAGPRGGSRGSPAPAPAGTAGVPGVGIGGGLDLLPGGTVVIDDTTVTGNQASTNDNDVSGTFTT